MANEDKVWVLARALLDVVVDGFDTRNIDLPARRLVNDSPTPAFDCELVAVSTGFAYPGQLGAEVGAPVKCVNPRAVEFGVWIVRCLAKMHDDGSAPTPTEIEEVSRLILIDLWTVGAVVSAAAMAGEFGPGCDSVFVGRATMLPAAGGFGGVTLRVAAQLV